MRVTGVAIVIHLLGAGCGGRNNFQCETNASCDLSGGGMCVAAPSGSSWCAYPDPLCPGGYRYSDQDVGDGLAGQCVEIDHQQDAGIDAPTSPDANVPPADWAKRFGGAADDHGRTVAIAPNGDVVMAGRFASTMNLGGSGLTPVGGDDAWVARFRPDGVHLWSVQLGGSGADSAAGVAIDSNGDVYVAGTFVGPVNFGGPTRTNSGGFLVKLAASSGAYLWDVAFGPGSALGVAVLDSNTVAIGGSFTGTVDFGGGNRTASPDGGRDSFVAAYSASNGAHLWSKPLTTSSNDGYFGGLVAVGGDVIVTAQYDGDASLGGNPHTSMGFDFFVARYRGSDGGHLWSIFPGGSNAEDARAIATDGTHVFVAGTFLNTTNLGGSNLGASGTSYNAFVASYDASNGSHVWSKGYGGTGNDRGIAVAANATRLAVSITFDTSITLGTQVLTTAPSAYADVAITRLNASNGEPLLATHFGSSMNSDYMALAYATTHLVGAGTFAMTANLFGTEVKSDGGTDIATFALDF